MVMAMARTMGTRSARIQAGESGGKMACANLIGTSWRRYMSRALCPSTLRTGTVMSKQSASTKKTRYAGTAQPAAKRANVLVELRLVRVHMEMSVSLDGTTNGQLTTLTSGHGTKTRSRVEHAGLADCGSVDRLTPATIRTTPASSRGAQTRAIC